MTLSSGTMTIDSQPIAGGYVKIISELDLTGMTPGTSVYGLGRTSSALTNNYEVYDHQKSILRGVDDIVVLH